MKLYTLLPACLLLALSLSAQPVPVKDITPGIFSATPSSATVYNGVLYFFANDSKYGHELWQTDRSNDTKLAVDIFSGGTDAAPNSANRRMAVADNKLFFPADNGSTGLELFEYSSNGLRLASDIKGGKSGSGISDMVALNGKVYFDADNGVFGKELWMYNTATQKAECVSFINGGQGSSDPEWLTTGNGKIYFTADDGNTGRELYEYDPVTNHAKLVADINAGAASSSPASLVMVGNILYFNAHEPATGRELYSYDGNTVKRLSDIYTGPGDGITQDVRGLHTIGYIGNTIYLSGEDGSSGAQLYTFDPGSGTATLLATINPSGDATPAGFIYAPNKMFFTADDGTHGREVFMMGSDNIPVLLADINTDAQADIHPANLVVYNGVLYFTAYGANGNELYKFNDAPVGVVDRVVNSTQVSAYPNPAHDVFNLRLEQAALQAIIIRLMDATGKMVYNTTAYMAKGTHTIPIGVAGFASGTYFYHVSDAHGQTIAGGRMVKR